MPSRVNGPSLLAYQAWLNKEGEAQGSDRLQCRFVRGICIQSWAVYFVPLGTRYSLIIVSNIGNSSHLSIVGSIATGLEHYGPYNRSPLYNRRYQLQLPLTVLAMATVFGYLSGLPW